jgi:hypothetical protein
MADLDSYIFVPTQQSKRFLALNNAQDPAFEPVPIETVYSAKDEHLDGKTSI